MSYPIKKKLGKHDGHNNDDRAWCYDCDESASEEEFTNWWVWNKCCSEFTQELKQRASVEKIEDIIREERFWADGISHEILNIEYLATVISNYILEGLGE